MRQFCKFVLSVALWICAVCAMGAEQSKLAIYGSGANSEPLADILTAELSALNSVTVVERRDLNKLVQEQSLDGLSSRAFANAGTILNANGVVILEVRKVSKGFVISVRLVSVASGAVIAWWNQSINAENMAGWAKDTALQLEKYALKLQAKRLPAISLVGFNSPSSTREAVLLQREINTLIMTRASAEPDLIVLERQKLLDAAFEKVLGLDDQKFWNGAYLLDGTINPTAIEPDAVTIQARVVVAGQAREFTVRGKRNDLAALAEQFVRELRNAMQLGSGPATKPTDAAAEADKFLTQAQNEVKWGLYREARAAADTSFALGRTDAVARKTRMEAYRGLCAPELRNYWQTYAPNFGVMHHYSVPPTEEALQSALELSYQLQDALDDGVNLFEPTNSEPMNFAIAAIGDVTLTYYIGAELRRQNEVKLAALRSAMRRFMDVGLAVGATNKTPGRTFELFEKFGPLWFETPEDGAKFLRRVRTAPNRNNYWGGGEKPFVDWLPPLAGWKWADRQRVDKVWNEYGQEEELIYGMRSRLFAIGQSDRDKAVEANLRTALEFAQTNQSKLMRLGYHTRFSALLNEGWTYQKDLMDTNAAASAQVKLVEPLKTLLSEIDNGTATFPALPEYFPAMRFGRAIEQVDRILANGRVPSLEMIKAFKALPNTEAVRALQTLSRVDLLPDSPEKQLIAKETKDALANMQLRQMAGLNGAQRMAMYAARNEAIAKTKAPADRPLFPLTNVLLLATAARAQAHPAPQTVACKTVTIAGGLEDPHFLALDFANDQLWAFISPFALVASKTRTAFGPPIMIPPNNFPALYMPGLPGDSPELAAFSDAVIIKVRDQLVHFERKNKRFRAVEAPIKSATMFREDNRLFIKNGESILETTSSLAKFEVVASVRRAPPASPLDRLPSLQEGRLLHGPDQRPLFSIGDTTYQFKNGTWIQMATNAVIAASSSPETFPVVPDLRFVGNFGSREFVATLPPPRRKDFRFDFTMPGHWLASSVNVELPEPLGQGGFTSGTHLRAAGGNLYLWQSSIGFPGGLYYISGSDLMGAVESTESHYKARVKADEQRIASVFQRYDTNKNGQLDPSERPALATEPILFNLVWSQIDTNSDNEITLDELSFFDFNHDQQFQPEERKALLNALSYIASATFLSMDENEDGLISRKEGPLIWAYLWQRYGGNKQPNEQTMSLAEWTDAVIERAHRDFLGVFSPDQNPFNPEEGFLSADFLAAVHAKRLVKLP